MTLDLDAFFQTWGLLGVFASSFLSATVLPGNSEAVLAAVVRSAPNLTFWAVVLATIGNTAGGMTSWWAGKKLPQKEHPQLDKAKKWIHRFGAPSLLLSWVPLLGDALCVAAGWLQLPVRPVLIWMTVGKALRYGVLVGLVALF